jgi:predicted transcriptional regulator
MIWGSHPHHEIFLSDLKQVKESDPNLSQRKIESKLVWTKQAIQYHYKQLRLVFKEGQCITHY